LKIDRSFVTRMCLDQEDRAIVQTIIALAHNLRLKLVAEGVETTEQLAQLKELGCEYGQGNFFSKPLDSSAAEELIAKSEADPSPRARDLSAEKCLQEVAAIERLLDEINELEEQTTPAPVSKVEGEMDQGPSPRTREQTSGDTQMESAHVNTEEE